jgi:hypothetical protein
MRDLFSLLSPIIHACISRLAVPLQNDDMFGKMSLLLLCAVLQPARPVDPVSTLSPTALLTYMTQALKPL